MVSMDVLFSGTPWMKNYVKLYNLCVNERGTIFKELVSLAAFVSESLWSIILESSPNLSKIIAVNRCYKEIYVMKCILRIVLILKIYQ